MRIQTFRCLLAIVVLAGNAISGAQLRGPVMGYAFDGARHAIRAVNGIPGSSVLGEAVALPFPVAAVAFSPRGDFALAVSASDDRRAHLLRHLGDTNDIDPIEGAIRGADRIVLNADATAGVLFASDARQIQVVRGLPDSARVELPVDLSSIDGTVTALAIDRTASNILIAVSADHGGLYLTTAEQSRPHLIGNFGSPSALALLNDDNDVIVADAAVNEITLLRNFANTAEMLRIAGERDGISTPVGLGISQNTRKLFIANARSRALDIWNLDGQSIEASYPLDAEPTKLTPLHDSSTFLLNDIGDHPLLVLDLSTGPAIYFVPAGRN